MAKLRELHSSAERLAKNAPEVLATPEAARGLEEALIQALITCIVTPDLQQGGVARHRRLAIMRQFRAVLEERSDEAIYIPVICAAIGVPERTLRSCCQEHLGMSPKQYLMLRRMHLARRALHEGNMVGTTVTNIATRFGFWELGRFAVAYKFVFGESPSATLRRSISASAHIILQ